MSQFDPHHPTGSGGGDHPWPPATGPAPTGPPAPGAWGQQPGAGGYGPTGAPGHAGAAPAGYPDAAPSGYPATGAIPGYPATGGPAADPRAAWTSTPPGGGWAGPGSGPATRTSDGRPAALNVAAALSFVTAAALAALSMVLITALIAVAATRSGLLSSSASGSTEAVLLLIVSLGTSFLLFWGGLDLAQTRSATAVLVGNGIALLLSILVAVNSTGFALLFAVVPALAIWTAILARNWITRTSR